MTAVVLGLWPVLCIIQCKVCAKHPLLECEESCTTWNVSSYHSYHSSVAWEKEDGYMPVWREWYASCVLGVPVEMVLGYIYWLWVKIKCWLFINKQVHNLHSTQWKVLYMSISLMHCSLVVKTFEISVCWIQFVHRPKIIPPMSYFLRWLVTVQLRRAQICYCLTSQSSQ